MNDFLQALPNTLYYTFFAWFIWLYYRSLKKCFWTGQKSRIKLFLISFVTNPFVSYIGTMLISALVTGLIASLMGIDPKKLTENANFYYITIGIMALSGIVYVLLMFPFSRIIGKWLKTPNRPLVTFVTMMFGVIFAFSVRNDVRDPGSEIDIWYFMDVSAPIIIFISSILTYRFVINPLSRLTDKKREINSKLFIVPPTIFCLVYTVLSGMMGMTIGVPRIAGVMNFAFSMVILFLFIWAFHVILNNIIATNEAIEAKELAAEMARSEARIEADLSTAKAIQISALPGMFPKHPAFELFASMNPAREVGGDFYDFYMLDRDTLGFLIADVSGKSIPGAMFMMIAKTVIKSLAESGLPPAEVFTHANERLCEGNEAEMFVTAWLGYLDLKTGLIHVANAGHNPVVLIRDGKAEYVILKPGLMLAGMEGIRYKEQHLQLKSGDMLYLYTDGITEAMNETEDQYGEERLLKLLSFGDSYPEPSGGNGVAEAVCKTVIEDVSGFTAGAEQSDDITMLCIRYNGGE